MKRTLAIILAALMLLSISGVSLAEEPMTISYYSYWCGELDPGSYVETYVEDNLGINIDVRKVSHQDQEAVNLMISTDLPDCGWFEKTPTYMYEQELVRTIPINMVREYCPSLVAFMDEHPLVWAKYTDPNDDTQMVGLPDLYETLSSLYLYNIMVRYDWIENLGFDMGDINVEQVTDQLYMADKGFTLDRFYDLLHAFVYDDPDQNGVDDTVGYVKDWNRLLGGVGMIRDNMEVDGYPQMWFTNPALKEMLAWLQKAYADGLIYKEIFTIAWGEDWELINNGTTGVHGSTSTNALCTWASNRPPRTLLDGEDKSIKLLLMPGLTDAEGHSYDAAFTLPGGDETFFVNADVDDEKLVEILKFYDYTNWNEDPTTIVTLYAGEEGVNWVWDETGTTPIQSGEGLSTVVNGERGTWVFDRCTQLGKFWEWTTLEPDFLAGAKYYYEGMGGIWNKDLIYPYKYDIANETDAASIYNEYSGDWENIYNNYFMQVIMGEKDLEGDWDAYIEEMNEAGYGEYLEELNKAPTVEELIAKYS